MKATIAVRLAASAILLLGGATLASAQEPAATFTEFSCVFNLSQIPGIPAPFTNQAPATTNTEKQCPGTPTQPTVILRCFDTFEGWPAGVTIGTNDFVCRINGSQCGFPGSRNATSQRLTIDGSGNAELRCSVNVS